MKLSGIEAKRRETKRKDLKTGLPPPPPPSPLHGLWPYGYPLNDYNLPPLSCSRNKVKTKRKETESNANESKRHNKTKRNAPKSIERKRKEKKKKNTKPNQINQIENQTMLKRSHVWESSHRSPAKDLPTKTEPHIKPHQPKPNQTAPQGSTPSSI